MNIIPGVEAGVPGTLSTSFASIIKYRHSVWGNTMASRDIACTEMWLYSRLKE